MAEDPVESIKRFVQDTPTFKKNYLEDIQKSGHKKFIDGFIDYCVMRKESKRGAVWLWGESNTGKSTLLRMLEKIFTIAQFK